MAWNVRVHSTEEAMTCGGSSSDGALRIAVELPDPHKLIREKTLPPRLIFYTSENVRELVWLLHLFIS